MIEMGKNEIDVSRMSGNDNSDVQTFDIILIGRLVVIVHKRFKRDVTIQAMIEAVTKATMIPTKAAIDPRPTTSSTFRVVKRPTRSTSSNPWRGDVSLGADR
jgi:hypothetical protein